MREVATPESPSGTIGSLELELIFDLTPWGHGRALMKSLSEEDASSEPALESYRKATFYDCQELLASVDDWMRVIRVRDRDLKTYLQEVAPGRSAAATIKRLHYGSPFQIELLLPLVSTAGLTSLFFIARRLYGVDLEFKAYREQRRVEYLEAKAKADLLATQAPLAPVEEPRAPNEWKLKAGTLRDPPS
jgi:hypothetical protein